MKPNLFILAVLASSSALAQDRSPFVPFEVDRDTYTALMQDLQRGVDFERAYPIFQLLIEKEQAAIMAARSKAAQTGAKSLAEHPAGPDAPPGTVTPPIPGALLDGMKGNR
jgi:hypothetical protein